jgi:D-sedoheptulose 7-phosphate isomerase
VSRIGDEALDALLLRHPALDPCAAEIEKACAALIAAYERGGKLLLCGNGGSAADCEHIAGELLKGFERARPLPSDLRAKLAREGLDGDRLAANLQRALPAVSLTGHPSFASAWSNDVDSELGFAQLVTALGQPGDVLLAISTSGQARNVQLAARAARAIDIAVIGLTGMDGGALAPLCDICIIAPARTTAEVQELHLPVYHYLCRAVEAHFFPD